MNEEQFLLEPIEELADNLEAYVKRLYVIREKIKNGELNKEVEADYAEALEILDIWNNMGEE